MEIHPKTCSESDGNPSREDHVGRVGGGPVGKGCDDGRIEIGRRFISHEQTRGVEMGVEIRME